MYKNKKVGIIGIIITFIILLILVIISNTEVSNFSKAENIVNKIVMPLQNGLTHLKNKIAGNNSFFQNIEILNKENEELKEENEELKENLKELEIIKAENTTLREYINISDKYSDYKTVPAYIINKDISNLSEVMIINAGTDSGVYEDMAVISYEGLVGYVISATKNTAKVQPVIDAATSISATMTNSRDFVIAKGELNKNNKLKLTNIPVDAELIIGDRVETSGIGGIYPKGILIGEIVEIADTKNITDRYAIIETAVNFSKLETVLVITK